MPTRQLLSRRRALAARLGGVEQVLAGSLTEQTRRCGKPGCRCADGEPHGPYAFFAPKTGGPGPGEVRPGVAGRGGAPLPAQRRGDRGSCWRRSRRSTPSCWPGESCVAGERRRPVRARAGRGGGGAGQHDHLGRWEAAVNGEHKITSSHRERAALIYLRQSSMAQVREHTESTRSQYAPGGHGGRAGLAAHLDRGDRHRPGDLRQVGGGPGGVHRAGHQGLPGRCRGDLRDRDHPAGPVQRRRGPAGGVRPDHRHAADRPGRRLRPRRRERPRPAGVQGHHGRDGAARDGAAAAGQQAGRGRARRAAHPAAGRATSTTTPAIS